jgi:uncharacterized protein YraI
MGWTAPTRRPSRVGPWPLALALSVFLGVWLLVPTHSLAQSCQDCLRYAGTELNLRQDPSLDAPVLRLIPRGAQVELTAGEEQNGYVPVVYDSVPGWAVALGLVATPEDVDSFVFPEESAAAAPAVGSSAETRVTLAPLLLRAGPSEEDEPILTMPEGAVLTVTGEDAANGYVTVAYDGVLGWAFADLLGEVTAS